MLHASCVAVDGRGVLILGPSGSGKSALALQLMSLGAVLVADDRVRLWAENGTLLAAAPETLRGLIEARGVGILRAETAGPVPVALAVDLAAPEPKRLPPERRFTCLDCEMPLLHNPGMGHFSAAILQYMKAGRDE
ncbi:serine kinase [Aquicoccus sp. SCR17]|nr:serine kinase [Carideicomes alvinocaridis]